jgi:thioredoxin-related protein
MRYFILFYIFATYLLAYSYQSDSIIVAESGEYVIIDSYLEDNNSQNLDKQEYIDIEYEPITPLIEYIDFKEAKKEAKIEHKFILIKIESTNCPTCSKLNILLNTNENIKNMVNGYTKAVKFNNDYEQIPPKLEHIGTPTLFLFDSDGKRMLIKLQGSEAIDDLEKSLELFIYDNN